VKIRYTSADTPAENGVGSGIVENILIEKADRNTGVIVFEAPADGLYEIYYMPFSIKDDPWYSPSTEYFAADHIEASDDWINNIPAVGIPEAAILRYESRTEFDSFYPMEFPMNAAEREEFTDNRSCMVVLESRCRPIRMQYELPAVWLDRPVSSLCSVRDTACINEHYVFQTAVIAGTDLHNIQISFRDANGHSLPEGTAVCFNLQGRDIEGKAYTIRRDAVRGQVLPLWCGLKLEKLGLHGGEELQIAVEVTAENADISETAAVTLDITPSLLPNNGDNDLWRMSRLFWLNSDIGISDDLIAPYEPILNGVDNRSLDIMGKHFSVGSLGLPATFTSRYDYKAEITDTETEILASPMDLIVEKLQQTEVAVQDISLRQHIRNTVHTVMEAEAVRSDIQIQSQVDYEVDGHIDCRLTLTAMMEGDYTFTLRIPFANHAAEMFMGMSYEGGKVPSQWEYRWDPKYAGNHAWIGGVRGGIQLKLMPEEEFWGRTPFESLWKNNGKGKMMVRKTADAVLLEGITGSVHMQEGQTETLHFHMITTPFHPINKDRHWYEHIYHKVCYSGEQVPNLDYAKKHGATMINLHQGGMLNENINYPFRVAPKLKEHVQKAHEMGMRYKMYYTVRELSNYCAEIWAFRALGSEIYSEDPRAVEIADHFMDSSSRKSVCQAEGTVHRGGPWLNEHLTEGFVGAWHEYLHDGEQDCAVGTKSISRLHNYYLCGLDWMIREVGIDGIYLDGIGYDRRIMKRVRRVMQNSGKLCDIDIHNGNTHSPCYGHISPANYYMEHFAYADSLWLGEGYQYEKVSPEYFLIESSGIPFGLMGEMLHCGGNPWRGMVYGMTARMGWQEGGVSYQIWKLWDEFGIADANMLGWWNPECPVSVENDLVRATAYVKDNGDVLIAAASWYPADKSFLFSVNKEQLGIAGDFEFYAPPVEDVQEEAVFASNELIPIPHGKGWLFYLRRK
jgi:hypothetical protein